MKTYRVARGHTVMHAFRRGEGTAGRKGFTYDDGPLPESVVQHLVSNGHLKDMLRDRHIIEIGRPDDDLPDNQNGALPGMDTSEPITARDKAPEEPQIKSFKAPADVPEEPKAATKTQVVVAKPAKAVGLWNHDPKLLAKKSLKELNVMVVEKDATMSPFDTVEEARAQLSLDFAAK